jgi:uncharacterized protein (DUF1501 family)
MLLTRRYFLRMSGAAAAYLGVCPLKLLAEDGPKAAVRKGKTLVVIFLRGGADGLNLVIPHGDKNYARLRKTIRIAQPDPKAQNAALDLDGYFGLHPKLSPLVPWFESGHAVAVHAVGHEKNTRSHFEEQDVWETGVTGNTINSDGWLNRHLATSEGFGPIRAVAIGSTLPRILHGKECACAIGGVEDLTLPDGRADRSKVAAALEHAYKADPKKYRGAARDLVEQAGKTTLDGIRELQGLAGKGYTPAAKYPESDLANRLKQAARLIKAEVGVEVLELDYDGWDTHQGQGGADGGFANLAGGLAGALAAFAADLGPKINDTLVVTLSDFGRTAEENGTYGTDHGHASCMFALGGPVKKEGGAKVIGKWPGLAKDQLNQARDLAHTTDFRDVLGEIVKGHLGNANIERVLPQHEFREVGIL